MSLGEEKLARDIADDLTLAWKHGLGWLTATAVGSDVNVVATVIDDNSEPVTTRYEIEIRELA